MARCLKIDALLFPGSCVRALKSLKLQLSYPFPFPIGVHLLAVTARVPAPTAGRGTPLSSVTEALLLACTSPYRHQHLCYLQGWKRTYSFTLLQETHEFKRFFFLHLDAKLFYKYIRARPALTFWFASNYNKFVQPLSS